MIQKGRLRRNLCCVFGFEANSVCFSLESTAMLHGVRRVKIWHQPGKNWANGQMIWELKRHKLM